MVDGLASVRTQLSSADEETRRQTVLSLRDRTDGEALSLLRQALGDSSWRVRKSAATVLRDFPDRREVVRGLIESLSDPDNAGLRSAAVEVLSLIGAEAAPQLLDTIHHPDTDVRKFVIDILGEIRDDRSVGPIVALTGDDTEVIRLAAVEALGSIGGDRAFGALVGLLDSDDVSMQFSVLHALGRLGKPLPFESVRPLLSSKVLRRALFDALGYTRSPEAVEFIVEGLLDPAKGTRQAAVRALHQMASDPAIMELARQAAQKKLASAPLEPFAEFLDVSHLATKRAAVTLLSLIGTPEAAALLMRSAGDDSIQVEVAEALVRIRASAPAPAIRPRTPSAPAPDDPAARVINETLPRGRAVGPMDNERFNQVRDLVAEESGMYYDRELKYLVERRVQRRMEEVHLSGYQEYFRLLQGNDEAGRTERRNLISLLSTNETYFFREDFQLKCFSEEIVPELRKKKDRKGRRRLRIWSAGCSSGEEPYTIAMLLKESPGLEKFEFDIIGSDISDAMVAKARAGLYTETSFRTTAESYLSKYFQKEGGRRRLAESVRQMVKFDSTNLITCGREPRLAGLDVIFCRNVIIYFSPEAKRKVVDQFYQLLVPGGYLLLGHSESLMNVSSSFELVHLKHDLVYRKPEVAG